MPIGFDLDEVIAPLLRHHCLYLNHKYHCELSEGDFSTYDFWNHYQATREQAVKDFFEFCETDFFHSIKPFKEARPILEKLSKLERLHVITARQDFLQPVTRAFVHRNFPGIFSKIDFGNYFGKVGAHITKAELCEKNGIYLLVEDDPKHIIPVSEDIPVVMLDRPWNQHVGCGRNIIRAYNWRDIGEIVQEFIFNPSSLL